MDGKKEHTSPTGEAKAAIHKAFMLTLQMMNEAYLRRYEPELYDEYIRRLAAKQVKNWGKDES